MTEKTAKPLPVLVRGRSSVHFSTRKNSHVTITSPWAAPYGITNATLDSDLDGLKNLLEYAFGTHPWQASQSTLPAVARQTLTVPGIPGTYLTLAFCRQLDADDLIWHVLFSADLASWTEDGVLVSSTPNGDGTATELWRSAAPVAGMRKASPECAWMGRS